MRTPLFVLAILICPAWKPLVFSAVNDLFADRSEIVAPVYHMDDDIHGATAELGEPLPPGTSQTLWWKFVAAEPGVLSISLTAPQFTPVSTFYEGNSLETLQSLTPLAGQRYRVEAGHNYALQIASASLPDGAFTLDVRFLSLTNDVFATGTRLEGTNVDFVGNLLQTTLEPGEVFPGYSNTIWVSWAAPYAGRAFYVNSVVDWAQPVMVFTGPAIDHLQPVTVVGMDNGRRDFLAVAGEVYHFQISGVGDECRMSLGLLPPSPPTNDMFASARRLVFSSEFVSLTEATAELGEPPHLDGAPFKSIWWSWTAPVHGFAGFSTHRSLGTNITLAGYQGTSVEALTSLGKGIGYVRIPITGGETYYLAAAVPPDTVGDVGLYITIAQSYESRIVPGNLLRDPSWEGIFQETGQYWKTLGGVGGGRNEKGGCDGLYWITMSSGVQIWQDIPTVPGQPYGVRFAIRAKEQFVGSGGGDGRVGVIWDGQQIGVGVLPETELSIWNWPQFTVIANNPTSRVAFVNLGRHIELDAFSVVSLTDPPRIITQPVSASVIDGGSVVFTVNAAGSAPLAYHWHFNDRPYARLAGPGLFLDAVTGGQAGTYHVIVSNAYGIATSAPATLTVDAPTTPVIVWQPYGDTVGVGGFHQLSVVAVGSPPLTYQWTRNGESIVGATNRILAFDVVAGENAGAYAVRVENNAGIVWSVNAILNVDGTVTGGGMVDFRNRFFSSSIIDAPVSDVDGFTLLNGSNYLAQLYGGAALESLRPVGKPSPFQSGFAAGFFFSRLITFPTVVPGSDALVQVRAWDGAKGGSYEEARGLGGRFGKSELFTVTLGGGLTVPSQLRGLQSFSLQAGRPHFASGEIALVEEKADGTIVWSHTGEAGYRYLIERSVEGSEWHPFQVITNLTTTATFTDATGSGTSTAFYRSRILD